MKRLGLYLPINRKLDFFVSTGMAGASLFPGIGLVPLGVQRMANLGLITNPDTFAINAACAGTALALSPFAISRGRMLLGGSAPTLAGDVAIDVCGMPCREDALLTGVLILGSTGTGKTSIAISSPLDQIFHRYNHPGDDPNDPFLNIGGFCLDAKMEFYEPQIYFMHDAGRNVLEDAVVLRPNCCIPVGVFEEPGTGRIFHLQGQSFSSGSDVQTLIMSSPLAKERGIDGNFLMSRPDDRRANEAKLEGIVFDVERLDIEFLGFRRDGSVLHPIRSIRSINDVVVDKSISIDRPKKLIYREMSGVDSGIRYNIVNNRASSVVAAKRLADIAALIDGGEGAKKDPYWDKQAATLFAQVMDAWRLLDGSQANNLFPLARTAGSSSKQRRDLGGPDILRIVEQTDVQENLIRELKTTRDRLAQDALALEGRNRVLAKECRGSHRRCDDLVKYFDKTWRTMAPNTKSIIESCVRTMFGPFAQDDLLAESFCSPPTISCDDMITKGTFFFFVAGNEYRPLAKPMGTAFKLDAHSTVLSRKARGELNQNRRLCEVIDECQMYAVAGEGGDQETKNMSRASLLFHFNASQSEASIEEVVGHSRYRTYVHGYGVRVNFQSMDEETRKRAANLTGQVYREKREVLAEDLTYENILGLKGGSRPKDHVRYDKELLYSEHVFLELDTWESITFNKDRKRWKGESKVHRQVNKPHPIGGPAMKPVLAKFLASYARSYAEYCSQKTKWNPDGLDGFHKAAKVPPPSPQPGGLPSTPSAPTTPNVSQPVASRSNVPPPASPVSNPPAPSDTAAATAKPSSEPAPQNTSANVPPESANTNAFLVRDPNADETRGGKRAKKKEGYVPPAPGLIKKKGQPSEAEKTPPPASSTPKDSSVSIEEATARYAAGKATPADLEVINSWCSDPAHHTALLSSYFSGISVDGVDVAPTQGMAQMAEHGGNPTAIHRGPRGASGGTPQGRGSSPGNAELGMPESSLDLSDPVKNQADALADATKTANKQARAHQSQFSIKNLRERYTQM